MHAPALGSQALQLLCMPWHDGVCAIFSTWLQAPRADVLVALWPCLHLLRPCLQVPRAAIFDLLTSQNDRHAQNLFINPDGSLSLIDNERAFYENQHFAIDSILLPTTKKYAINVMENAWIHKFANWGDKVRYVAIHARTCMACTVMHACMIHPPCATALPAPHASSCVTARRSSACAHAALCAVFASMLACGAVHAA